MITFLPLPDLRASLQSLDSRRLMNQRREALVLLTALKRGSGGWSHHPATRMWSGYEDCLAHYLNLSIREFVIRGGDNQMELVQSSPWFEVPWWFGSSHLHSSHQAILIRKEPKFYAPRFAMYVDTWSQYEGYAWPRGKRGVGEWVTTGEKKPHTIL